MSNQKNFSCPIDVCIFVENSDKDEDYEFDENDSHITQLVKHFCDSDKDHSDSDSINKLNTKMKTCNIKAKAKESFNSLSTNESQCSTVNLYKISSIYKQDMKKSISSFKSNLFNELFKSNFSKKNRREINYAASDTDIKNASLFYNLSPFRKNKNNLRILNHKSKSLSIINTKSNYIIKFRGY